MKSIEWVKGKVRILDQTRLPLEEVYLETDDHHFLADAIKKLKIRGAPAIGIAGAFGIVLGIQKFEGNDKQALTHNFEEVAKILSSTRPTAVNLFWALNRMRSVFQKNIHLNIEELKTCLLKEAKRILEDDIVTCQKIGKHGNELIPASTSILTHCNTGALATGGYGTAQSVIVKAHENGKRIKVYVDETRPLLQGARLTTWELMKRGIDVILITDNTAAFVIKQGLVNLILVGADRIAANGDVANKIGTYNLAVLAEKHHIPMYVAAPVSTIDFALPSENQIPIEERDPKEVTESFGKRTAPKGVKVYSPAFDVTPNELITAIITEEGILTPPFKESITSLRQKYEHSQMQS